MVDAEDSATAAGAPPTRTPRGRDLRRRDRVVRDLERGEPVTEISDIAPRSHVSVADAP